MPVRITLAPAFRPSAQMYGGCKALFWLPKVCSIALGFPLSHSFFQFVFSIARDLHFHGFTLLSCLHTHAGDVAQLVCTGCRVLLMYPRGANSVQCSLCGSINSAQ